MDLDASVIARLQGGDVAALEVCYRQFGPPVQRLCRRLVGRDGADDAAQEVFLRVLEHASQYTGRARFSTWLYQVATNHCLRRVERERIRTGAPLGEERAAGWAVDTLRAVDDRDEVERWLAEVTADQRAVLVLRELEGLDYAEIALVLGVPEGTVMSRLHRARQRLIELERASRKAGAAP
jgi:RNA polymerase sigma-70 factor, ECF subfamily